MALSIEETRRQSRLTKQILAMHAALWHRYRRRAVSTQSLLLVCSTIFCATTFAGQELYDFVGISARAGRFVLGLTSVAAFGASLVTLVLDWAGHARNHAEAVRNWSHVLQAFRESKTGGNGDGWDAGQTEELNRLYWEACRLTTDIPDRQFNNLKAHYLRKVEVSKLVDAHPGCPHAVARLLVSLRGVRSAMRERGTASGR